MLLNPANEWNDALSDHPIFSLPQAFTGPLAEARDSLELSTNTLPRFVKVDPLDDEPAPSGRRQTVLLKDADLIVAVGREIRMTTLGDAKGGKSTRKTYKVSCLDELRLSAVTLNTIPFKVLHTPNVQFAIHQISLNPNGKLLAVAGAFQVAVIVLPRPGFTRLVPETIDCKYALVLTVTICS
jgi:nucleoporin NUP82